LGARIAHPLRRGRLLRAAAAAAAVAWLLALPSSAGAVTCDFTWDGGGGTNAWADGANWNPDASAAPGQGGDIGTTACIGPGNSVVLDDVADLASLLVESGAGVSVLPGADLNVNAQSGNDALVEGDISVDAGLGGSASFTSSGPMTYDAGSITLINGATFQNSGSLAVMGGVDFLYTGTAGGSITNNGTITVDTIGGDGVTTVEPPLNNDLQMDIVSGTLAFGTSALSSINSTGTVNIGAGAELELTGSAGISGPSTLNIDTGLTPDAGGKLTYDQPGGTSPIGATVHNNGVVNATHGHMTFSGGADGAGNWNIGGDQPGDAPTIQFDGAGMAYTVDGVMSDLALGGGHGHFVINVAEADFFGFTTGLFVNDMSMTNGAVLDFSPADFSPARLQVNNLDVRDSDTFAQFDVDATMSSVTLFDGSLAGGGEFTATYFHWAGGELQAPSSHGKDMTAGELDLSSNGLASGTRTQANRNLVVVGAATGDHALDGGTWDVTSADVSLDAGVRLVLDGDFAIGSGGLSGETLHNNGVIEKRSGAGTSTIGLLVDMPTGEIDVGSGELHLNQDPLTYNATSQGELTGGTYRLTGTLSFDGPVGVNAGAILDFDGGHLQDSAPGGADALTTLNTNSGTLLLANSTLSPPAGFTNTGQVTLGTGGVLSTVGDYIQNDPGAVTTLSAIDSGIDLAGDLFQLQAGALGGVGTITGDLISDAVVTPGTSPGTLSVTGDYIQNASGSLQVDIAGPDISDVDRVNVGGNASLDGRLVVNQVGGYHAPRGQAYPVITSVSRSGSFATIVQPTDFPFYDVTYGSGAPALVLVANGVSIGNATVAEGAAGTPAVATFTIAMGQAAPATASVAWATHDGTAAAGSDYTAGSGTVTFTPGQVSKTVSVPIAGDSDVEPDETFTVALSNPAGTRIAGSPGTGTITNDDQPPPVTTPPAETPQPSAGPSVAPGDIDGQATAPPPVQGKVVNVEPVKGTVLVRLPGRTTFVLLPDKEQIPTGSVVDARRGTVKLFSEGKRGEQQAASFFEGIFQIKQKPGQALTEVKLVGANFKKACPKPKSREAAGAARAKKKKKKSVQHLWGEGSGRFRTTGRFASATIRGTKWLTDDRCDGTLVRVRKGAVTVKDLTLKKTLAVKAPRKYLAPAEKQKKR
jgi:fibronectin-binding autotransporter adhesin